MGTGTEHRLRRLRELIAQLERLPATAERDRMLREVRGRLVDIDTGTPPTAFLPEGAEAAPAVTPGSPPKRARRVSEPTPAMQLRAPRPAPPPARPVQVPPSRPARSEPAEFVADVVVSLDDSTPFWPDEAESGPAPWTRGLRG